MSTLNDNFFCFKYQDHYDFNMQKYFEVYIEVQNTSIDTMYHGNRQYGRLRTWRGDQDAKVLFQDRRRFQGLESI